MNPVSPKTALITGASGFIGGQLTHSLINSGYQVRLLVRRLKSNVDLPDNLDLHEGDILDRQVLKSAVQGTNIIFHLAAILHRNNLTLYQKDACKNVNIEGTRRLVEAAKSEEVDRLVFFSTVNVYGKSTTDMVLDENSPVNPISWYAKTKAHAEQIVLAEIPAVVLRLSAVYGPQMKGNYPALIKALQKGFFIKVGQGLNRRTLVYIHDVCRAAVLAAEHPNASGKIYNVSDGRIYTMKEIIAAICKALGTKTPRLSLPANQARASLGAIEDTLRFFGHSISIGRHTIDKLVEDLAVSADRIQQELGFVPQFSLPEGWNDYFASS